VKQTLRTNNIIYKKGMQISCYLNFLKRNQERGLSKAIYRYLLRYSVIMLPSMVNSLSAAALLTGKGNTFQTFPPRHSSAYETPKS